MGMILCEGCHQMRKAKGVIRYKGKMLCFRCRQRTDSQRELESVQAIIQLNKTKPTLSEALEKEYNVYHTFQKRQNGKPDTLRCFVSLPTCLAGHKVKIVDLGKDETKEI